MEIGQLRITIGAFLVIASICTTIFIFAFQDSLLEALVYVFVGPGAISRTIVIALLFLNLKSLPLAWHASQILSPISSQRVN